VESCSPPSPSLFPYTTLFRSTPKSLNWASENAVAVHGWCTGGSVSAGKYVPPAHCPSSACRSSIRAPQPVSATFERSACVTSWRSEEHTSELQSRFDLVCRLL